MYNYYAILYHVKATDTVVLCRTLKIDRPKVITDYIVGAGLLLAKEMRFGWEEPFGGA